MAKARVPQWYRRLNIATAYLLNSVYAWKKARPRMTRRVIKKFVRLVLAPPIVLGLLWYLFSYTPALQAPEHKQDHHYKQR